MIPVELNCPDKCQMKEKGTCPHGGYYCAKKLSSVEKLNALDERLTKLQGKCWHISSGERNINPTWTCSICRGEFHIFTLPTLCHPYPTRDDHDYMELLRWCKEHKKWWDFRQQLENDVYNHNATDILTDRECGCQAIAEFDWEGK